MVLLEAQIQLVPDGTLLLHLLMVVVMVFIVNRTLLKPINRILAEREKQIAGRLQEAEALAAETEQKRQKFNEALHAAREGRKGPAVSRTSFARGRGAARQYQTTRAVGETGARNSGSVYQ
jgi:hypothetical protein